MGSFEKSDWAIDNIWKFPRRRKTDASKPEKHDVVPATVSPYLDRHYRLKFRDHRFADEEHYEWFKDYSHFRDLILREIEPNASILEVGCGYSQLCEELYRDGITELTCIDLSPVAAEKMKQRLSSKGFKGCIVC
ncbi:uncharacterized protein LOC142518114 [Primulina tabacum]|uniref:uncharacterized protein LOC142518114 n=1 Tax=Primulina tabacum TaxID=48773 RepID=UPI003F5ABC54